MRLLETIKYINKDNHIMNDEKKNKDTPGKVSGDALRSDWDWRNMTAEGYAEWIGRGDWNFFITINYNIWRNKKTGRPIYNNATKSFDDNSEYQPYDKENARLKFQSIRDNKRIQEKGNDDFWLDEKRSAWDVERKMQHAKGMIRRWDTRLHQALFGNDFYRKTKWKDEKLTFILFPENIHSNLHYHGVGSIADSEKYPKKVEKFLQHADRIWYSPPYKKKGWGDDGNKVLVPSIEEIQREKWRKESICPGGQLWIREIKTQDDLERIAGYSTKQLKYAGHEQGLYITNDWRS
jgi:hypothetical protein